MFENKKILLICKESYSYPLYFLAQKWRKNNKVAAFFFNPCETMYNECYLNDSTYYAYKRLENIKLYTSDDIAEEFTKIKNSKIIDFDFLQEMERRYTHFSNLNMQIISTQFFTRHYHFRNYMHTCTYEQQMNWLILNYKNIIGVFDDFRPDIIIDTDSAELARCVINEVAYVRNIPYISLSYLRYDNYLLFSFSLGKEIEKIFIEKYNELIKDTRYDFSSEKKYITDFREKSTIMPERFKNTVTSRYRPKSLYQVFSSLFFIAKYFFNQDISARNLKLKKKNKILYNDSLQYILFYAKYEFKNRKLLKKNKYFEKPVDGDLYIYMPLHLIPESTTATLAPMYLNEFTLIEAVSKSLPAGWWLYVKEHQSMLGERGFEFYRRVNRLPNVRLVQINYYHDPKPWIIKSQGVITISGTTAYEAALLGKKSAVFSNVSFSLINSVKRVKSLEELPEVIKDFSEPIDNIRSCEAYLATSKILGESINIKYLMDEGEKIIRGIKQFSHEYENELNSLEILYLKAYKIFESGISK